MARKIDAYRVKDRDPILDPAFWNQRLADIDLRLHGQENGERDWTAEVRKLNELGLRRIDEVLVPAYNEVRRLAHLGALFSAHSASEVTLEPGQTSLIVDLAQRDQFAPSLWVGITADEDALKAAIGQLVAYDRETGVLTLELQEGASSGTFSGWSLTPTIAPDTAHNARKDNPHEITPAQIGAASLAQLSEKASLQSLQEAIAGHDHDGDYLKKEANAPAHSKAIGDAEDLNDYTTPGFYHQLSNANAEDGTNYPVAKAGALSVWKNAGFSQLYVTYHPTTPEYYFRSFYGDTWSAWNRIFHSGNVSTDLDLVAATYKGKGFDELGGGEFLGGQMLTTSGERPLTEGTKYVYAVLIGGGGGTNHSYSRPEAKGGDGAQAGIWLATPDEKINITVGAAGADQNGNWVKAPNGGDTIVGGVTARGGEGGTAGSSGATPGPNGSIASALACRQDNISLPTRHGKGADLSNTAGAGCVYVWQFGKSS